MKVNLNVTTFLGKSITMVLLSFWGRPDEGIYPPSKNRFSAIIIFPKNKKNQASIKNDAVSSYFYDPF